MPRDVQLPRWRTVLESARVALQDVVELRLREQISVILALSRSLNVQRLDTPPDLVSTRQDGIRA